MFVPVYLRIPAGPIKLPMVIPGRRVNSGTHKVFPPEAPANIPLAAPASDSAAAGIADSTEAADTGMIPIDRIKRDVAKIDRELHGGQAASRPDFQQSRLERAFGRAYRGGSLGFTVERYVSPDGIVISRKTRANSATCYVNDSLSPSGQYQGSEHARPISCPPEGSGWQR